MNELWLPIKEYETLYAVSNMGRVKSLPKIKHTPWGGTFLSKEKMLKPSELNNGYLSVTLSDNKVQKKILVHILVGIHFVENPLNLKEINHKDLVRHNNVHTNLEWCTHSYNVLHAINKKKALL